MSEGPGWALSRPAGPLRRGRRCGSEPVLAVIALRRNIERWRRHPIIGPILIVLLVVMLAFVFLHESHEQIAAEVGELCVGIALLCLALLLPAAIVCVVAVSVALCFRRGPPPHFDALSALLHRFRLVPIPLRL